MAGRRRPRRPRLPVAGIGLMLLFILAPPSALAQNTAPPEGASLRFALTAASDGAAITEQTYRGQWLVVYFGYTSCPDVCPTTLLDIGQALDALGPRAGAVRALFITVDPKRDTQGVLAEYLKSFDPRLVALTGTPAQIAAAAKDFHVFHERQDSDDGSYSIDHSAFIYLIDRAGRLARTISSEGGSKQIAEALSALMSTGR
jgi:protein SCO1/2